VPVSSARYTLMALAFCVLWASAFIAIKVALLHAPPMVLMSTRFLAAGGAVLGWARAAGARWPAGAREWRTIALLGVCNNVMYLGVTAIALQHISAGLGAVMASLNPVILAIVSPWLLDERLTAARLAGLLTSFAGVSFVMWSRVGDQNQPWAMALFLAVTGFMVAGTVLFKRARLSADLVVVNGGQLLVAGLVLGVPALLEAPGQIHLGAALVLAQGYLVVAVSGVAMMIWLWLLAHGDAARASAWFFLNPVLGLFMGALLLGEPLHWRDFAGAAAVALGIYVVQRT
jgi:drug/metabolite transporter (DMT)-like permease